MANSDIIKIGFDYRASLAQFEKDTNGVFDGISNKAGKQKITIQLDAKDDKVIDKIKELQKLKLDKFTFEFGDSGLKEQLQTFDKLESKINEIINLGKGKSFIDSSSTVSDIGKIENKINELNKNYEEAQKKLSSIGSGNISGKDVNLVDNEEFKKLSQEVSELKNQFDDLKTHMQLLDDYTVPTDRFFELQSQVEATTVKVSDLVDEFIKLSNAQKALSSTPQESNISSGMKDAFHSDIDTSSSVKSLENLEEEIKKIFTDANELQNILDSLHNGKYFHLSWTTDGIDATGADERVRQLSKLLKEYGYTINNFKSDSDAFDTSGVINAIKEENNVLEQNTQKVKENTQAKEQNANVNLNKYDTRLDSYNGKLDKYQTTINRFNDGGWTSKTYLENVQAVRDAVKQYATLLDNIKTNQNGIASDEDIQNLDKYEKKIKETIATVTNMSASEKGYNFVSGQKELDKIHKLLNENSKMSSEAKAKIKAYYAEIESGNPSMSLDKIHGEILKIYNAEVEAGRAGRTLWDTLKNSGFHQIAAQMAGMIGVYDVINLGKEAVSTIVSLDDALVDLKKTTAMNSTQLEQYYYDANDVAKQMGVTTEEIINQSSAWSRLGYNTAEASTEMAKLSSQFASISPGMEVDEAQSGLVSIMKAWSIDPDQVKSEIMDPINQLGNTMAEDNQDIVEGMERSAAALAAVGTSTKDAFALFSGIQEVLQNAEKSGTSLRSVALRLRSFDETTGEYSEDLANITGELIDLTKTAEHAEGVSIFKPGSTTEFKDLTDYFREIAGIWDEMTQKQQNDFLIKAFGRNQAQAGAALIQNFEAVDKALAEMGESAGSSDKEMEAVESSLSYKINALKETWVGCVQDMIDRGDLGTIVTGLTKVSEAITFLLDKLGILGSIGLGAGIFSGIKNVGRDKMYSLSFEYADNIHNLLWIQRFKVCYP